MQEVSSETLHPWYIVGFVDGEGSFIFTRQGETVFKIVNTNREVIERFKATFGFSQKISERRGSHRTKPLYTLSVARREEILKLVEFFTRYPPIVKRGQFQRFKEAFLERNDTLLSSSAIAANVDEMFGVKLT